MTVQTVRDMCRALAGTTQDIKWGADLVFSVGGKMYAVVCLDPPHTVAFKCSPEDFADLVERDGIIPAPYLARAMWVQEQALGQSLDRHELMRFVQASYALVRAKLPKSRLPQEKEQTEKPARAATAPKPRARSVSAPKPRRR